MEIKLIAQGSTQFQRFIKRWGISFFIDGDIIFDLFGKKSVFKRNIKKMKIDLSKIKHIVISHDHWDHIAGLEYILKKNKNINVYVCKNTLDTLKNIVKISGAKLVETEGLIQIKENVFITGEMKGSCAGETIYEQSIVIKTEQGLVVVTGCAHPGICNIIKKVKNEFREKVYMIIGGFHLKGDFIPDIYKKINVIKELGIKKILPLHCTGSAALNLFRRIFWEDCILIEECEKIDV